MYAMIFIRLEFPRNKSESESNIPPSSSGLPLIRLEKYSPIIIVIGIIIADIAK
jgi:hypothetical protein